MIPSPGYPPQVRIHSDTLRITRMPYRFTTMPWFTIFEIVTKLKY